MTSVAPLKYCQEINRYGGLLITMIYRSPINLLPSQTFHETMKIRPVHN